MKSFSWFLGSLALLMGGVCLGLILSPFVLRTNQPTIDPDLKAQVDTLNAGANKQVDPQDLQGLYTRYQDAHWLEECAADYPLTVLPYLGVTDPHDLKIRTNDAARPLIVELTRRLRVNDYSVEECKYRQETVSPGYGVTGYSNWVIYTGNSAMVAKRIEQLQGDHHFAYNDPDIAGYDELQHAKHVFYVEYGRGLMKDWDGKTWGDTAGGIRQIVLGYDADPEVGSYEIGVTKDQLWWFVNGDNKTE